MKIIGKYSRYPFQHASLKQDGLIWLPVHVFGIIGLICMNLYMWFWFLLIGGLISLMIWSRVIVPFFNMNLPGFVYFVNMFSQ